MSDVYIEKYQMYVSYKMIKFILHFESGGLSKEIEGGNRMLIKYIL